MGIVPDPILILGASGGIGAAVARQLGGAGYPVIIHGRDRTRLEELATSIGPAASVRTADLTEETDVEALFNSIRVAHSRLAGVVFSVATPFRRRLAHRLSWGEIEQQIATQLKALHISALLALPFLADGSVTSRLVVLSTEAVLGAPPPKTAGYAAAKAALTAYAQVIAQEWLRHNIRVHIVAPGLVKTTLTADMPEEFLELLVQEMPEGRLTSVDDVAALVAFLMTDAADTLYGTPVRVSRAARK